MARLIVVNNVAAGKDKLTSLNLHDIDKVQSLREHTINPPGQERNIKPIDEKALAAWLAKNSIVGKDNDVIAAAKAGDISNTELDAATGETLTTDQVAELQDILSVRLVETGKVLLSIDRGVIAKAVDLGWVVVVNDDGTPRT